MPALLDLSPDELLSTTRAVRRRLDLERRVEPDHVRECIELAAQAPTATQRRVVESAAYLAEHMAEVPVHGTSAWPHGPAGSGRVAYTRGTDFKAGPPRDLDRIVHHESW